MLQKKTEANKKEATKSSLDQGCMKASQEAKKADNASSAADSLFYYRRALRFCPSEARYHVEIAKVYKSIGRQDDAKFELSQALKINADFNEAKSELSKLSQQ